jgi:hypothetical protein
MSFKELNFTMAFTVDQEPGDKKGDRFPEWERSLVEWWPSIKYYDSEGYRTRLDLKYHLCNEKDWAKFSDPLESQKVKLATLKNRKIFYCFDEE